VPLGTIRRRDLPFTWGRSRTEEEYTEPSVQILGQWASCDGSLCPTLRGTQVTESENHVDWDKRFVEQNNIGSRVFHEQVDVGGDFTMKKQYVQQPFLKATSVVLQSPWVPSVYQPWRLTRSTYRGPLSLGMAPGQYAFPPFAVSSDNALAQWGTKAIAQCAPTNSTADLASALIELRKDGIPKLMGSLFWKKRIDGLRGLSQSTGDEYLNLQFGWKPLLADVKDVATGLLKFEEKIRQYEKDAGRIVRRRYSFPPSISKVSTTIQTNATADMNPSGTIWYDTSKWNTGTIVRTRLTTVNRWFSGAFTYYLPRDYQSRVGTMGLAEQARQVLGLDLTPEVLWNVAPWSWAADWFSSTGDVIHNITNWSSDGLVLRYGYIMEHSIVSDTYTYVGETGLKARYPQRPDQLVLVSEAKIRRRATPFGFGLDLSALTSRQKAILAALGISRLK